VIPWVMLYHLAASFGVPRDAFHPGLEFEPLPVIPWTSLLYFSEYPAVAAVPFLGLAPERFRKLLIHCWISIAIAFLFYFTLPSIAPRPPVPQDAFLGSFLSWERGNYPASVAFPSFHVIWAVLIAWAAASNTMTSRFLWWGWALAVCLTCVTTGMHWISDVVAGFLVCWAAIRYVQVWEWMRRVVPHPGWALWGIAVAMVLRRMWVLETPLALQGCLVAVALTAGFAVRFALTTGFASRFAAVSKE
jgi:membrane-associated phospholipid phosphatase